MENLNEFQEVLREKIAQTIHDKMEKCIWERMLDKCEKEKTILAERVEELEANLLFTTGQENKLAEQNEKMLSELKLHCELCRDLVPDLVRNGHRCDTCTTKALIAEIETKEDDNG